MSGHSHHSAAQESGTWPRRGRSSTKRQVRVVKVGEKQPWAWNVTELKGQKLAHLRSALSTAYFVNIGQKKHPGKFLGIQICKKFGKSLLKILKDT